MNTYMQPVLRSINTVTAYIAAVILLQTLYFKFTGHPESVVIFSMLHAEPWGRIIVGILELFFSILIIIPRTRLWGALAVCGLMIGAIGSHIFVLGTMGMHTLLFQLALICFACALVSAGISYYTNRRTYSIT